MTESSGAESSGDFSEDSLTTDHLLGGRVRVHQPRRGFRVAADTLILAAAVPAQEGEAVIDLGCGVGAVLCAVAWRVRGLRRVVGLEIQKPLLALARRNFAENATFMPHHDTNGVEACFAVHANVAELCQSQHHVFDAAFDHVTLNPPWHIRGTHPVSATTCKGLANHEATDVPLRVWVHAAATCLHENGTLTAIYPADRAAAMVDAMGASFVEVTVRPVITRVGKAAKRAVIQARKSSGKETEAMSVTHFPPFVLMREDGSYTPEARRVLWEGGSIG